MMPSFPRRPAVRSALCLLGAFAILAACQTTSEPFLDALPSQKGLTYIDTHNHLHGLYRSEGFPEQDYDGAARVALAKMNELGIKKMLIMPPPFTPGQAYTYEVDAFLGTLNRFSRRFGFLGGGGSLNVMIQSAVEAGRTSPQLRRRFEKKAEEILSKGALGFGEMATEHLALGPKHPHVAAPPDHPLFLLLADIAARNDVPIDIHMEAVPEEMSLPEGLKSPPNPRRLRPNIAAFERLLAHNRKAKIIWVHVGWDNTGRWTPALARELLERHPNLYMSAKVARDSRSRRTRLLRRGPMIKGKWLNVIRAFPDRFLIGSDEFFITPLSNRRFPRSAKGTNVFLSLLPPELARKVGYENAKRVFKLSD